MTRAFILSFLTATSLSSLSLASELQDPSALQPSSSSSSTVVSEGFNLQQDVVTLIQNGTKKIKNFAKDQKLENLFQKSELNFLPFQTWALDLKNLTSSKTSPLSHLHDAAHKAVDLLPHQVSERIHGIFHHSDEETAAKAQAALNEVDTHIKSLPLSAIGQEGEDKADVIKKLQKITEDYKNLKKKGSKNSILTVFTNIFTYLESIMKKVLPSQDASTPSSSILSLPDMEADLSALITSIIGDKLPAGTDIEGLVKSILPTVAEKLDAILHSKPATNKIEKVSAKLTADAQRDVAPVDPALTPVVPVDPTPAPAQYAGITAALEKIVATVLTPLLGEKLGGWADTAIEAIVPKVMPLIVGKLIPFIEEQIQKQVGSYLKG